MGTIFQILHISPNRLYKSYFLFLLSLLGAMKNYCFYINNDDDDDDNVDNDNNVFVC
jgi:hypothetical protein